MRHNVLKFLLEFLPNLIDGILKPACFACRSRIRAEELIRRLADSVEALRSVVGVISAQHLLGESRHGICVTGQDLLLYSPRQIVARDLEGW